MKNASIQVALMGLLLCAGLFMIIGLAAVLPEHKRPEASTVSPHQIHSEGVARYYIEDDTYYLIDRKSELCFFVTPGAVADIPLRGCIALIIRTVEEEWKNVTNGN